MATATRKPESTKPPVRIVLELNEVEATSLCKFLGSGNNGGDDLYSIYYVLDDVLNLDKNESWH